MFFCCSHSQIRFLFRNSTGKSCRFPRSQVKTRTRNPRSLELHQVGSVTLAQRERGRDVSGELGDFLDVREQGSVDFSLVRLARFGGLLLLQTLR